MASSSIRWSAFGVLAACLAACSSAPVASFDPVPRVVNRVFPEYPAIARREGIEGKVTVLMYVNARGVVERIEQNSSPHQALTLAAIDAFLQWRFDTPVENGRRIAFVVEYSMEFHLTDPVLA
jgi:TonB family protein